MRSILGFYRVPSLANNNIGAVATFGEIDRQRMTYTTEERNFSYPSEYPNTELVTFQVVDELSQPVLTTETLMKKLVSVGEWLTQQHRQGSIPANGAKDQFYAALKVEFGDLQWLSIGDLIRSAETSYFMPTHVEFTYEDSGYEYYVKIWLAARNFQDEYEPFRLFIIPPVDDLEQFINNTVTMTGILASNTHQKALAKYNAIRQNNPETRYDTYQLPWYDLEDPDSRLITDWSYLAYGIAGTSVDNIKTGIRDYLANNSDFTEWNKVFPSLYEETDFTIIPFWDKIAVPETQLDQNLYASYINLDGLRKLAYKLVPTSYGTKAMVEDHINKNMEVFSTSYRGMMLGAVANPSNLNDIKRMSLLYPDYASTPTSDPDFERMQESSRSFSEKLIIGLEKARTLKESDTVPPGYYRTRRNGLTYLTFLELDFQHMILTRESYLAKISQVET